MQRARQSEVDGLDAADGSKRFQGFEGLGAARAPLLLRVEWVLLAIGALARIHRYIDNRPLWGDEASLALNLVSRSAAELAFSPLEWGQSAPPLFLVLERLVLAIFGNHEMALRALPLLAGLASLWLFADLARRELPRLAATFAILAFAISEPLVFYASETKQYSSDVLIALCLLRAGLHALDDPAKPLSWARWSIGGILAVWSSHAAVFVLGGVGGVLILRAWQSGAQTRALQLCGVAATWLLAFGLEFALSLSADIGSDYLRDYWGDSFAPFPPTSWLDLRWYLESGLGYFNDPLGFPWPRLAAAFFLAGAMQLGRRNPARLALLLAPLVLALAASALGAFPFRTSRLYPIQYMVYPFLGRLLLFSLPAAFIVMGHGFSVALRVATVRTLMAGPLLLASLFAIPLQSFVAKAIDPPQIQDMRTLVGEMKQKLRPGDIALIFDPSIPPFEYYARRDQLRGSARRVPFADAEGLAAIREHVAALEPGRRFWLVTLHHQRWLTAEQLQARFREARGYGRVVDYIGHDNAEAIVFEVVPPEPRQP